MKRLALVALVAVAACRPDFAERASLVTTTRVLAVRSEPPEAKPGDAVTLTALVASPEGVLDVPVRWAFCATPRRLTENGAVSPECLGAGVRPIEEVGTKVTSLVPSDACFLFGPEVSSAELRPRDPDATGGFYQPVRVVAEGAETPAFAFPRVTCRLGNAGAEAAAELARAYRPNRTPELLPLELRGEAGVAIAPGAVPRSARVVLRAAWPEADAETYAAYDPATDAVVRRREAMRVSWFATSGVFDEDRTGRDETELEAFTENGWTAPAGTADVHLFVVLRDARGATAFTSLRLAVR